MLRPVFKTLQIPVRAYTRRLQDVFLKHIGFGTWFLKMYEAKSLFLLATRRILIASRLYNNAQTRFQNATNTCSNVHKTLARRVLETYRVRNLILWSQDMPCDDNTCLVSTRRICWAADIFHDPETCPVMTRLCVKEKHRTITVERGKEAARWKSINTN